MKDNGGLKDGYAPFCKHLFVPNFTEIKSSCVKLTPENSVHMCSGYEARRENELAVLGRWLDVNKVASSKAEFLDIILYSKEQMILENASTGMPDIFEGLDFDYGIVSIKP